MASDFVKKTAFAIGSMGLGLAGAFAAGELALRAFGYTPTFVNSLQSLHVPHERYGWLGVPNHRVRFKRPDFDVAMANDSAGFRAIEPSVDISSAATNIVFLGDSFAWGWGVEADEVFSNIVQNRLGSEVRVLNRGIAGFGTVQQMLWLEDQIATLSPSLVVLMAYPNDFTDNIEGGWSKYRPYLNRDLDLANQPPTKKIGSASRDLRRHSYFATFVNYHLSSYKLRRKMAEWGEYEISPYTSKERIADYPRAAMAYALARIHRSILAQGTELLVVYVPESRALLSRESTIHSRELNAMSRELGVEFFDLARAFSDLEHDDRGQPFYFARDPHWTPEGHRVVGEYLAGQILTYFEDDEALSRKPRKR